MIRFFSTIFLIFVLKHSLGQGIYAGGIGDGYAMAFVDNITFSSEQIIKGQVNVNIYPQPLHENELIAIDISGMEHPSTGHLIVSDMQGNIMINEPIFLENKKLSINMGQLKQGLYLFKFSSEQMLIVKKVVII